MNNHSRYGNPGPGRYRIVRDDVMDAQAWTFTREITGVDVGLAHYCAVNGCDPLDCRIVWGN